MGRGYRRGRLPRTHLPPPGSAVPPIPSVPGAAPRPSGPGATVPESAPGLGAADVMAFVATSDMPAARAFYGSLDRGTS